MKVLEGERLRPGYGFAWRNYESRSYEAYIVPFNFLARWFRDLWRFLAKPRRHYLDQAYLDGYEVGRENGENTGYIRGKRDGDKEGYERFSRELGIALIKARTTP